MPSLTSTAQTSVTDVRKTFLLDIEALYLISYNCRIATSKNLAHNNIQQTLYTATSWEMAASQFFIATQIVRYFKGISKM